MMSTVLIAITGLMAGRRMSDAPGSPTWVEAAEPDDVRAGLKAPGLHEEALPNVGFVAMTPNGMSHPGPMTWAHRMANQAK